ncbi:DNA cytosine methyltransferase [Eremococcus coleocola]|uniref:DNA cytosine methyltransferase n=1 Tax=Eremococcus coleocola TaxID=88132 RepID=UPI00200A2781|nr:DNA (cytosine-5-)-methyltransferase [Eremococcus coleocola]
MTVKEKANEWKVSERQVQYYCRQMQIEGVLKQSGVWLVPKDAKKPSGTQNKTLRMLSLFSGCGGMDLGFEGHFDIFKEQYNSYINSNWDIEKVDKDYIRLPKTRFSTVFANDILQSTQIAWSEFFANKESVYCLDSIVDLVKLHKKNNINIFPENIDIVIGGFPCQDFSVAGKRLGFKSENSHTGGKLNIENPTEENRGQLYIWMREVISIVQPKVFVAENVKGLTNLGDVKQIIEADFASISDGGYYVFPARVLMAADYGVSQSRERVIFIGIRKKCLKAGVLDKLLNIEAHPELDPYPKRTHSKFNEPGLLPYVTVREVLRGLEEPDVSEDIDQQRYSKAKFMGKHCQGQNEVELEGIAPTIRSEHHGNIEFRRLSAANGGKYLSELSEGKKERRLTIRECARIQSFPDNYQFVRPGKHGVSATNAYKMIGNAVPPLLAFHIAKRLEELWPIYFG